MRKLPLVLVGVLALALGVAGIAQAVNSKQTITVKLQKNKAGTKKKPKGIGKFTVDLKIPIDPSDEPFATKTTVVHFDKNLVFNYKVFPTCNEVQVRSGAAACNKAKVGSGQAQGVALGQVENLAVTAFNGPSGQLLLHVKGSQPLDIDSIIVGKLGKDSGAYGNKLSVVVPDNLQEPLTGVKATLTRFTTVIDGSKASKGKPYIGLKGCPASKKLNFGADFEYTDGTSQSPTTTAACRT
jgi:hypothetical protein